MTVEAGDNTRTGVYYCAYCISTYGVHVYTDGSKKDTANFAGEGKAVRD